MFLSIGDMAPDFTLMTEAGEAITLHALRPKRVVLYFYPKDSTPGCTQEACDFRDAWLDFQKQGVLVFGISKDSAPSHQRFKTKHALSFPLLVDADGDVCRRYGVLHEKSLWGKLGLGIERSTFLIDATGHLQAIWRKVKVKNHVQEVYDAITK